MKRLLAIFALAPAGAGMAACGQSSSKSYVPGIGEFMMATQVRHAKLWFAGEAQNWDLAEFELHEIKEGLEDASRLHPTRDGLPIAKMIKRHTQAPFDELSKAIEARSSSAFSAAFDILTAACNACHTEARHAFIKIKRPTTPPASNQVFSPAAK